MTNIIGISGLAGSGKDTVAECFLKNKGVVKIAFADPIKRFAQELWNLTNDQVYGESKYRTEPDSRYPLESGGYLTSRHILQGIGTVARELDQDVWARYGINIAKQLLSGKEREWAYSASNGIDSWWENCTQGDFPRYDDFPEKVNAVIISDARFINELSLIKKNGGIIIRVIRPGAGLKGDFGKHISETEMSNIPDSFFDYIIENIGTLEELNQKVQNIYSKIML